MNARTYSPTLIAVFSSILSLAVHAQPAQVPGSASTLTLQMTAYATVEGTVEKDENGKAVKPNVPTYFNEWSKQDKNGNVVEEGTEEASNVQQFKISNKEILEALVAEGVISDISGWALTLVAQALSPDDEGGNTGPYFYIVKSGVPPIHVGNYFEVWEYSSAEAYKRQAVTKYKFDSEGSQTSSSYTESGSISSTTAVYATFSTENGEVRDEALLQLNGIWQESSSLAQFGNSGSQDFRFVPKSATLTNISGDLSSYDKQTDTRTSAVMDGSWSAKSTVLQDISADYPEAAAP